MRKTYLTLIGASLAVAMPVAASAQDEMPGDAVALTPEQQVAYEGWPPDKKLAYGTWPDETKAYYWSLSAKRQKLFWRLSDDDKLALSAMPESEQEATWDKLESQAAAEKPAN